MASVITQAQIKEAVELLKVCLAEGTIRDLNNYSSTGTRKLERSPLKSILSYGMDFEPTHEEDDSYFYVSIQFQYNVPAAAIKKFLDDRNSDDAVKNLIKDL